MPRRARLLVPGGIFHIIARGNERRKIFLTKFDYEDFLSRLETGLEITNSRCLAWALMPNHFHLLIQAGPLGTAPLMRRLMTGYAGGFNRRYHRSGHLFQNRYKAFLCEKDTYLLELVRYIHLNPVRAGIVKGLEELKRYPWTGHGTLVGYKAKSFQDVDGVLGTFGAHRNEARRRYLASMEEGLNQGRREDLMGGGLLRSMGRKPGDWRGLSREGKGAFDERILGSGQFVEAVLKEAEKGAAPLCHHLTLEQVAERVANHTGVELKDLLQKGRRETVSRAKALLIYLGTQFKAEPAARMGQLTGMSAQAASKAKERGRALWNQDPSLCKLIS